MSSKKRRRLDNDQLFLSNLPKLRKAAEAGDLNAQHDLAAFYATDEVAGLKDETEAVRWYTRAAERGHGLSQYDLGLMLLLGEGTQKNVAQGLWWMEQAVENGWEYAARVLSDIYEKGLWGVEADSEKAAYWNKRAGDRR